MSEMVEDNREENALIYASDNIRHLSRMELSGGGQIVIQGRFAYVGHQHGPGEQRSSTFPTRASPKLSLSS